VDAREARLDQIGLQFSAARQRRRARLAGI
jgi:hypothetical protein